jgi:hypothetical protein
MVDYSFLLNHFGFEIFSLNSNNRFIEFIKKKYEDIKVEQFEYAYVLVEFKTDFVFQYGLSTELNFNFSNFKYYLSVLPELNLNNINLLLTLSSNAIKRCNNPFEFDDSYLFDVYQCSFSESYGKIVYRHQFRELLDLAENSEKSNRELLPKTIEESLDYLRRYNCRENKIFDILSQLHLLSGVSILSILQYNTPIKSIDSKDDDFGFLYDSSKSVAIEFVKRAKQYLPTNSNNK